MAAFFEQSCSKHENARFLGSRKLISKEVVTASDGRKFEKLHLGEYECQTYGEAFVRGCNFASGVAKLGRDADRTAAIFLNLGLNGLLPFSKDASGRILQLSLSKLLSDMQATNIILNPRLAFGTGEHPTTKLCLLLLYSLVKGGELFLGYGTGSGILGIAALKSLVDTCIETAAELLQSNFGKEVLYEVAVGGTDGVLLPALADKIDALHRAIAYLASQPKTEKSDEEHVENFHSSRTIRKLVLDCPTFASTLWKMTLKGKCETWAQGHSCKVVSAFMESSDSKLLDLTRQELQPLVERGILNVPETK